MNLASVNLRGVAEAAGAAVAVAAAVAGVAGAAGTAVAAASTHATWAALGVPGLRYLYIPAILIGLIACFFGYRVFRFLLSIAGLIVGGILIGSLAYSVSGGNSLIGIFGACIGALIGAALAVTLYFAGVFLMGALFGMVVGTSLGAGPTLTIILAVIAGIVAIFLQRLMIMLSTAFSGAWAVVNGVAVLAHAAPPSTPAIPPPPDAMHPAGPHAGMIALATLVLGLVGLVAQLGMTRRDHWAGR